MHLFWRKKGEKKSCRNWSSQINAEFANFMSMHILQILRDMCCFHCIWFRFFAEKALKRVAENAAAKIKARVN